MKNNIHKTNQIISIFLLFILFLLTLFANTGCSVEKHSIDYCGQKQLYKGTKDEYPSWAQVILYYNLIRTDMDYLFYLDGQQIEPEYDHEKGYVIAFTMPDHDVTLECIQKSSTNGENHLVIPIIMVNYYRAVKGANGDGYYEMVLCTTDTPYKIALDVFWQENKIDDEIFEQHYMVPYSALEECYAVIDKYGMSKWNDMKNSISLDGALTVCRFVEDGETFRVTSEAMPEDGEEAFEEIRRIMSGYLKEEYIINME